MSRAPQFLPNGFRFRRGLFGTLVLQRKMPPSIVQVHRGDGWVDADINDVFGFFYEDSQPPSDKPLPAKND